MRNVPFYKLIFSRGDRGTADKETEAPARESPPEKGTTAHEEWDERFRHRIRSGAGVLTGPDKEEFAEDMPEWLKPFKEEGFIIALKHIPDSDKDKEHNDRIAAIHEDEKKAVAEIEAEVERYNAPFQERISFCNIIINQVRTQIAMLGNSTLAQLLENKRTLDEYRAKMQKDRLEIDREMADKKHGLLDRWIDEAKAHASKILTANEQVQQNKKRIAREAFAENKDRNEALVARLSTVRGQLEGELKDCNERASVIAGEGHSRKAARFLIKTGYLALPAAGLLFSVFTSLTKFGSEDIATFIIEGLLLHSANASLSDVIQIRDLLFVLIIIGLTSLLCRAFVIHIRKRDGTLAKAEDREEHDLQLMIKNDMVRYSGRFTAANWSTIWFRIIPLILCAGVIIIFIADEAQRARLFDSIGGAVIGGLMALAMAGFLYLYTVKFIESRMMKAYKRGKDSGAWLHLRGWMHWELVITFTLFMLVTCAMAVYGFYGSYLPQEKEQIAPVVVAGALLWFLLLSIMSGFIIAYGVRYQSLREKSEELNARIFLYDDLIDQYSGHVRTDITQHLNNRADIIFSKLMQQLERRNDVIFQNRWGIKSSRTHIQHDPPNQNKRDWLEGFLERLQPKWRAFIRSLENFFLPYAEEQPKSARTAHEEEWRLVPWEEEFFADLYHRRKLAEQEIIRCTLEINAIDNKIRSNVDVTAEPLATLLKSHRETTGIQEVCNRMVLDALHAKRQGITVVHGRYKRALRALEDGYQSGRWYKQQDATF